MGHAIEPTNTPRERDMLDSLSKSGVRPSPSQTALPPFAPGEIVVGKYEVIELIGEGGVGFVMSAKHLGLDTKVALKFLRPQTTNFDDAEQRFTLEAQACVKIKSDHVVRVLDVDRLGNGTPFMVMEFLDGLDLERLLAAHGALPSRLAVDYVLQACEALATAHAAQVIHRDVKPGNLFLAKGAHGRALIKMLDFGISKVSQGPEAEGRAPITVGSPPYMAPEQVRAEHDVDARADVWGLGCVLYELLTTTSPFARASTIEVCTAVLEDHPPPLETIKLQIAPELAAVIMRCLDKDPNRRFQDVGQLATALVPFGPSHAHHWAARCRRLLRGADAFAPFTIDDEPTQVAIPIAVPKRIKNQPIWVIAAGAIALIVAALVVRHAITAPGTKSSPQAQLQPTAGSTTQPHRATDAPAFAPVPPPIVVPDQPDALDALNDDPRVQQAAFAAMPRAPKRVLKLRAAKAPTQARAKPPAGEVSAEPNSAAESTPPAHEPATDPPTKPAADSEPDVGF